jgi:hypothetical protein
MIAAVGVLELSILLKTCSHGDIRRDEELCVIVWLRPWS